MADDAVTVEQLRRWYLDTLRASVLASDPVRVTAWTGLAAEIRAALGDAGVVAPVQAPATSEAVSPWRSVATDSPRPFDAVVGAWSDRVRTAYLHSDPATGWISGDVEVSAPEWWMLIPPLPVSP